MYRSSRGSIDVIVLVAIAAGLLGAGIIATSVDNAGDNNFRQSFLNNFNQVNTQRALRGAPLLDWCSECYRANRTWALEYDKCVERIHAYERGDTTALTWPELPPEVRPPAARPPRSTW